MRTRKALFDGLDGDALRALGLRLLIGLVWFGVAIGGALLLREGALALRLAGLIAVGLPPLIWMYLLQRQARVDELEARLAMVAQAQGCWWAVSFGAVMYALNQFTGSPVNAVLLAIRPAGAYFFGEFMAQVARASLQRSSREE